MTLPSLATVMDLLLDAVCVLDEQGHYVYVNAGFERMLGYGAQEVLGQRMIELVHPDDRERTQEAARNVMDGRAHLHFQNRYLHKDGRVVHIMWAARWSPEERVRIGVARDVTELKHAEAMQSALLAISEAAHAAEDVGELCRHIHAVVGRLLPAANCQVALHEGGRLSFPYFADQRMASPGTLALEAAPWLAEVLHSGQPLLIDPTQAAVLPAWQGPAAAATSNWLGVPLKLRQRTLGALAVHSYDAAVRYTEQDKLLLQFVSEQIAHAIERKRNQARLQHLASHDPLTGLLSRGPLHDRLAQALERVCRGEEPLALLYLDLDGFKAVNDRHGHDAGDRVLCEIAQRLRNGVRHADTVARLGGDEFVVLLEGAEESAAQALAQALRASLQRPCVVDASAAVALDASIGIALYPRDGADAQSLLRHADRAMYHGKRRAGRRGGPASVEPG